jgi:hypothetical protein
MVKAGLLDLVAAAGDAGWSTRRAALLLGLDLDRVRRWAGRRAIGELADRRPGGGVHAILPAEREAILTLAETWAGRSLPSQAGPPRLAARDQSAVSSIHRLMARAANTMVIPEGAVVVKWRSWVVSSLCVRFRRQLPVSVE